MKKHYHLLVSIITVLALSSLLAHVNGQARISGRVKDAQTMTGLPGANVVIDGTTIGTISNIEGEFTLGNAPEGNIRIRVTYVGYVTQLIDVTLREGINGPYEILLEADAVGLEEVVITAQMLGQAKAINQQLNSDALVNVVSSDKMRELPDINAAEAIGRLPGVSVNRSGGEANRIVLRGLSPELTSVTINGVRVPSSGVNDRSVDLSMISPELLSNIEVYKAPTADMDGDAIGGIVNLGVTRAPFKKNTEIGLFGGYNGLNNELSNYRGYVNLSRRFFDNKFGVIAKANFENINRSSENVSYTYNTDDTLQYYVNAMNLVDQYRTLQRLGSELQMDYAYKSGYVMAQGFLSQRSTDIKTMNNNIVNAETVGHGPSHSEGRSRTYQAMLKGEHRVKSLQVDYLVARSNTLNDNYYDVELEIVEYSAVEQTPPPIDPKDLFNKRLFNYSNAFLNRYYYQPDINEQITNTAALDFKLDYNLGSKIAGFIKLGAKYRSDDRYRDHNHQLQNWYYLNPDVRQEAVDLWPYPAELGGITGNMILMSNFYGEVNENNLWGKEYFISPTIDMDLVDEWHKYQKGTLAPQYDEEFLKYSVYETVTAGYFMAKINVGRWLTMIPGIRYEYSDNEYTGVVSSLDFNAASGTKWTDTTYQTYGEWLPNMHMKIKPLDWLDLRLSAVKTLARPNFNMITPRAYLDITNGRISKGNPDLKHAEAWNYDASISIFSNKIGLFTIGGFYKHFDNYFAESDRTMSAEEAESLGYPVGVYEVREDYVNFDDSEVYGFEMDLQTNLNYLPAPFNGIVLNFNATRLYSTTYFPLYFKVTKWDPALRRNVVDIENSYYEFYKTNLPDQVKWISNFSIGYDYKGFSSRFSLVYQSPYLLGFSSAGEASGVKYNYRYSDQFMKLDAVLSQKITKNVKLLANLSNITSESERTYQYLSKYPRNENRYGFTFEIGAQVKL